MCDRGITLIPWTTDRKVTTAMAEKLRTFDFTKASDLTSSEKASYPWEDWLDGDIWQLHEGTDFQTHPLMMERIIRTRATSKKARVRLRHLPAEEGNSPFGLLIVQRTDIEGPTARKLAEANAKRAATKAKKASSSTPTPTPKAVPVNGNEDIAALQTATPPVRSKRRILVSV